MSTQALIHAAVIEAIDASPVARTFGFAIAEPSEEFETSSAGWEVPIRYAADGARATDLEDALHELQRAVEARLPDEYINLFFVILSPDE